MSRDVLVWVLDKLYFLYAVLNREFKYKNIRSTEASRAVKQKHVLKRQTKYR